ncbi:MAG: hypothetical protein A2719_04480 [Candidatus Ryanbacteria bacterium RIFCSPHIGHO2_01_FULL_45_22]|uniref:UDP-N-acetylmuramoyl-L-alanyl-D-glutamate--2, 6-diaminopimelate ligase n=1 Tax=Candidatus Ryanbacteria bacterium RIFCSPHIGHO2_01_FULL_45_22 TaxID=1802114 RepID=A0A1G2G1W4_9BACT|nr:MAG: hypothetical protein A2719_04480 [Candidatus Ryanbacteria bacterium RIFCSPHIGHO2_01_FULL_45_22]
MNQKGQQIIQMARTLVPKRIFLFFQPFYHKVLAWLSAFVYRFPSQQLTVIGVTGTNGKSTTVEFLSEIMEEAGDRVASASSIRFRIADHEKLNDTKMTMPGRFFLQKFLRLAVRDGVTHVVLEVTSEGIEQFRHKHIKFDIAVITNITPEHIESHGSFEAYRTAKAELFRVSPVHILNEDDKETYAFLSQIHAEKRLSYSLQKFPKTMRLRLPGDFNRANAMAALTAAEAIGIPIEVSKRVLERIDYIPGRLEVIQTRPFGVVVDYAHTPDALEKVYKELSAPRLICVLGSAGGGRDKWKRPEMGRIAARYCASIILTNEDPYDENPVEILKQVSTGFSQSPTYSQKPTHYKLILDRRQAMSEAFGQAQKGDVVLITGKGCERYMAGPNGEKTAWDDREVAREELQKLDAEKKNETTADRRAS